MIAGGVFVGELLSVILQVGWFKYTKRRHGTGGARCWAIHHHFKNWAGRDQVVLRFWVLSLGCALASLATLSCADFSP